jgi:dUTP pyrophosphatase
MATLRVYRMRASAVAPRYKTSGAAGMDLAACLDAPLMIAPGGSARVPTGLRIALPPGHEGQVRPRSGLAARHQVTVLNAPGTIDEDYRGEVQVILVNHGSETFTIEPGDRIAQLIVAPVTHVDIETVDDHDALGGTERGEGGFGSTGV